MISIKKAVEIFERDGLKEFIPDGLKQARRCSIYISGMYVLFMSAAQICFGCVISESH